MLSFHFFLYFLVGEVKSTQERRSALHLFRLGDAMLRIVRSKSRPLLHLMRCWSLVAPHLVEVRMGDKNGNLCMKQQSWKRWRRLIALKIYKNLQYCQICSVLCCIHCVIYCNTATRECACKWLKGTGTGCRTSAIWCKLCLVKKLKPPQWPQSDPSICLYSQSRSASLHFFP